MLVLSGVWASACWSASFWSIQPGTLWNRGSFSTQIFNWASGTALMAACVSSVRGRLGNESTTMLQFWDFMQVHGWIHCWIPVARFLNGLATCWVNMLVHFWWWKSKSKGLNPGNLELWKSVDTQLWNQQNARTQQTIVGTPFETDDHSTKYLWVFYISSAWLEWPRTKKVPTTFWAAFLAPPFLTVWHLRFTESPPHRIGLDYNTILQSISPDALLGWYRLPPAMRA